jgi:hypothetical protein
VWGRKASILLRDFSDRGEKKFYVDDNRAKSIPPMIKTLLSRNRDAMADRGEWINPEKEKRKDASSKAKEVEVIDDWDPTRVVTFQVPMLFFFILRNSKLS